MYMYNFSDVQDQALICKFFWEVCEKTQDAVFFGMLSGLFLIS